MTFTIDIIDHFPGTNRRGEPCTLGRWKRKGTVEFADVASAIDRAKELREEFGGARLQAPGCIVTALKMSLSVDRRELEKA